MAVTPSKRRARRQHRMAMLVRRAAANMAAINKRNNGGARVAYNITGMARHRHSVWQYGACWQRNTTAA